MALPISDNPGSTAVVAPYSSIVQIINFKTDVDNQ